MPCPFNIGDFVRCVESDHYTRLHRGQVYQVEGVSEGERHEPLVTIDLGTGPECFFHWRFIPWVPEPGDQVALAAPVEVLDPPPYTVVRVFQTAGYCTVSIRDRRGLLWYVFRDSLVPYLGQDLRPDLPPYTSRRPPKGVRKANIQPLPLPL